MKEKIKNWWNKPITNGDIVSSYVKSVVASYIVMKAVCHYISKKMDADNSTGTVDVSFETTNEE